MPYRHQHSNVEAYKRVAFIIAFGLGVVFGLFVLISG